MENQIISEAFEDSNAKRTVLHLVLCILSGLALDTMFLSPFTGFWCIMSALMYIGYITVLITKYRAEEAENVKVALQLEAEEIGGKEKELNLLAVAIKEKANALNLQANAMQKLESDVQTLSDERRLLTSQMQTLSADLANAKQDLENAKQAHSESLQTLKQAHEKATSALLTEKQEAEINAERLEKKLNAIKAEEEERAQRKSIKATWSASGKNEAVMAEKFAGIDWQGIVL